MGMTGVARILALVLMVAGAQSLVFYNQLEPIDVAQAGMYSMVDGVVHDDEARDMLLANADQYAASLAVWEAPPWYLQPTAALVIRWDQGTGRWLAFNQAVFLAGAGAWEASYAILNELQHQSLDDHLQAHVAFFVARHYLEAYRHTEDPEHRHQTIAYLQESLVAQPDLIPGKRLLEFMLSLDPDALPADLAGDGQDADQFDFVDDDDAAEGTQPGRGDDEMVF